MKFGYCIVQWKSDFSKPPIFGAPKTLSQKSFPSLMSQTLQFYPQLLKLRGPIFKTIFSSLGGSKNWDSTDMNLHPKSLTGTHDKVTPSCGLCDEMWAVRRHMKLVVNNHNWCNIMRNKPRASLQKLTILSIIINNLILCIIKRCDNDLYLMSTHWLSPFFHME